MSPVLAQNKDRQEGRDFVWGVRCGKASDQKHVKKGTLLGGPKLYDAINGETRQRMMKWRRCVNKSKKFYLGIVIGKAILWDCLSLRLC